MKFSICWGSVFCFRAGAIANPGPMDKPSAGLARGRRERKRQPCEGLFIFVCSSPSPLTLRLSAVALSQVECCYPMLGGGCGFGWKIFNLRGLSIGRGGWARGVSVCVGGVSPRPPSLPFHPCLNCIVFFSFEPAIIARFFFR